MCLRIAMNMAHVGFESGLSVIVTPQSIVQQDQFDTIESHLKSSGEQWPIYIIATRPKVSIVPGTLAQKADAATFTAKVELSSERYEERSFTIPIPENEQGVSFSSSPPYRTITAHKEGRSDMTIKVTDLLGQIEQDLRRFHVLYIGQAVGKTADYTVVNRLSSHSTLQKIYFAIATNEPWLEVCVVPCSVEPYYLGVILPGKGQLGDEATQTERIRSHIYDNAFPSDQLVNLGEASLIRHFQPTYNEMFVRNFPDKAHVGYTEAYLQNYNMVSAELCGEEIGAVFFNHAVQEIDHVVAQFSLVSEQDRVSMLDPTTWFSDSTTVSL